MSLNCCCCCHDFSFNTHLSQSSAFPRSLSCSAWISSHKYSHFSVSSTRSLTFLLRQNPSPTPAWSYNSSVGIAMLVENILSEIFHSPTHQHNRHVHSDVEEHMTFPAHNRPNVCEWVDDFRIPVAAAALAALRSGPQRLLLNWALGSLMVMTTVWRWRWLTTNERGYVSSTFSCNEKRNGKKKALTLIIFPYRCRRFLTLFDTLSLFSSLFLSCYLLTAACRDFLFSQRITGRSFFQFARAPDQTLTGGD